MTIDTTKERAFNAYPHEARGILAGRQTMFRRPLKFQPNVSPKWEVRCDGDYVTAFALKGAIDFGSYGGIARLSQCPYGKPGDRLWVRETFCTGYDCDDSGYLKAEDKDGNELPEKVFYRATEDPEMTWNDGEEAVPWKPSIHMPRALSRITLEITGVKVERVRDISEADAMAEGFSDEFKGDNGETILVPAKESFRWTWHMLNHRRGFGWEANPWVWVVEFKRVEEPGASS